MIKNDINEEIIYKVARMLDYEMENLQIDTYAKAELLVMFKYVLEHVEKYRQIMPIDEEYEKTAKRLLKHQ